MILPVAAHSGLSYHHSSYNARWNVASANKSVLQEPGAVMIASSSLLRTEGVHTVHKP